MKTLFTLTFLLLFLSCKSQTLVIDKLIFHTSICFGTCPVYHMELDGARNVKLFAETVFDDRKGAVLYQEDTAKMGYFIGKLSKKEFQKILNELNRIRFDTLQSDSSLCCDGSKKTIILYSKGDRKEITTMFEPPILEPLIKKLYRICELKRLKKVEQTFQIEPPKNL
ncbi:DUF6438 domain-containing protein [Pedobacter nutrimenti]|uniref:DUF6438 domain-containing protein n=1 Tax=Pedobacter nutrimenti TaxID=1241337 RepID=A0A318UPM0_9SPHI|nr:DUF6438 domain-containing protein [Pedobacter nutrimenti]PYF77420.1 hypothetical protein B0O44_101902 [Pedobacter nutrimenti]